RERLGVGAPHVRRQALLLQPVLDELDGCVGEVDAARVGARAGEAHEVRAQSDADLQHPLLVPALELGEARDERLELVAGLLDLAEELRRALLRARVLRAARRRLPVAADALLLLVEGAHRRHSLGEPLPRMLTAQLPTMDRLAAAPPERLYRRDHHRRGAAARARARVAARRPGVLADLRRHRASRPRDRPLVADRQGPGAA